MLEVKDKRTNRNSILFAVFFTETLICSVIDCFISIPYISVIMAMFISVLILITNKNVSVNIMKLFVVMFLIYLILGISCVKNGMTNILIYIMHFTCFGLSSLLLVSVKLDVKKIISSLVVIYCIYLISYFFIKRDIYMASSQYWSEQMGVAYGFAPIVLLSFIIFIYPELYYKGKKFRIISTLMGCAALYFMLFDCGTRGAIVVVVVGVALTLIFKLRNWKAVVGIVFFGICIVWMMDNYMIVITQLSNMLNYFDIHISAVDKMVRMISKGTEYNGRDVLSSVAKQYFFQSPLIGNGVGYFENMQDQYVHNIVWQILCEYGIIGFVILGSIIIKNIYRIFLLEENSQFMLFLFLCAIPLLLFSNTYWLLQHFWIYFFYIVNDLFKMKKKFK